MSQSPITAIGKLIKRLQGKSKIPAGLNDPAPLAYGLSDSAGAQSIGYIGGIGDGGAVTQITSKSTGVTLSKISGAITLNNASLADATTATLIVTNTKALATHLPQAIHKSAGTAGAYLVWAHTPAAGSFKISVRNVSGGSLSEAIVVAFNLYGGAVD